MGKGVTPPSTTCGEEVAEVCGVGSRAGAQGAPPLRSRPASRAASSCTHQHNRAPRPAPQRRSAAASSCTRTTPDQRCSAGVPTYPQPTRHQYSAPLRCCWPGQHPPDTSTLLPATRPPAAPAAPSPGVGRAAARPAPQLSALAHAPRLRLEAPRSWGSRTGRRRRPAGGQQAGRAEGGWRRRA